MVRGLLAAVLLAGCLAVPGCGRGGPAPAACRSPSEAVLPGAAGTLDESATGSYCLAAGQVIDVFLHAASPARPWSPIASSHPEVLAPQRTGVLTAPVGVTPGIFAAVGTGIAELSSTRQGGPAWSVTIVVR